MILADTSIWIDHFRKRQPLLRRLLEDGAIVMHPWVTAELALGSLQSRLVSLHELDSLPQLLVVQLSDVRRMIEARECYGKGIGLTDAHLLASCLATPGTVLWTGDRRLDRLAALTGVRFEPDHR